MTAPDFRLVVNDELVEGRFADITAQLAREYRQATGSNIVSVLTDFGPDSAAALLWLAWRQRGRKVSILEVEKMVSVATIREPDDAPAPDAPAKDETAAAQAVASDPEGQDGSS